MMFDRKAPLIINKLTWHAGVVVDQAIHCMLLMTELDSQLAAGFPEIEMDWKDGNKTGAGLLACVLDSSREFHKTHRYESRGYKNNMQI